MKLKTLTLFFFLNFCLFPFIAYAATYNYYFSDDATGNAIGSDTTGDGSIGNPWKTLSKLDTVINFLNSDDIVNAYFDRGDTWTWDSDVTGALIGQSITSSNPIVNIDAYGTGNAPIFDGTVTDFSTVPVHNASIGPYKWSRFFHIGRDGCSISNIEISGVYGHGIYILGADNFTLTNSVIHDFGSRAISTASNGTSLNHTVSSNTFHTGQQLFLNSKTTDWSAAIQLGGVGSVVNGGNTISHNLIYDIMGEGIIAHNSIIEYNIIGDTCSTGIMMGTHQNIAGTAVSRYNLLTFSDYDTSDYDFCYLATGSGKPVGIRIYDDEVGGDNSGADFQVYGNITINRQVGFWFFSPPSREIHNVH